MSCPRIALSVADHFDVSLSQEQRQEHEQHLASCADCRLEVGMLQPIPAQLNHWQDVAVPDWDRQRAVRPVVARTSLPSRRARWRTLANWIPLAASLVLAIAVVTQTRLQVSDDGWILSFGDNNPASSVQVASVGTEQINALLAAQAAQAESQQIAMRQWVEAALRTHGEATADNLMQWVNWMEQQRQQDVQRMEAGFQQLLDRDFQTVDSVRQLASYVMYQELP
jgi:hypothetical protein